MLFMSISDLTLLIFSFGLLLGEATEAEGAWSWSWSSEVSTLWAPNTSWSCSEIITFCEFPWLVFPSRSSICSTAYRALKQFMPATPPQECPITRGETSWNCSWCSLWARSFKYWAIVLFIIQITGSPASWSSPECSSASCRKTYSSAQGCPPLPVIG